MGVVIVKGEGTVLGLNLGRPIVTNGDFATRLFPNYFGHHLFILCLLIAITSGTLKRNLGAVSQVTTDTMRVKCSKEKN